MHPDTTKTLQTLSSFISQKDESQPLFEDFIFLVPLLVILLLSALWQSGKPDFLSTASVPALSTIILAGGLPYSDRKIHPFIHSGLLYYQDRVCCNQDFVYPQENASL